MLEIGQASTVLIRKPEMMRLMSDVDIDGRIILKCVERHGGVNRAQ